MDLGILKAFGLDLESIKEDPSKLGGFVPVIEDLKNTFKKSEDEEIVLMGAIENGQPIFRVLALKQIDGKITVDRNVTNEEGEPMFFNFIELISEASKKPENE